MKKEQIVRLTSGLTSPEKGRLATKHYRQKNMEKGIRKIEQNGVHVAYLTCPQIKLNKYKDATMLSLWHIKGDSMDFILDMPELQDIRMYACKFNDYTALSKLTHLRKLCINGIATKEEQTFDYIANLSALEELIIGYIQPFIKFPNLSNLHSLYKLFIFECKNLVDIKSIANIPNLRVFDWCCSQLKPTELEFVMQKDSIQKVAAQFGGKRLNEEFKSLLMKYNL